VKQRHALVVSPHPDDEVLGCGATITLLRGAGWQVTNLACSLGRPVDHERRRAELYDAAGRLGIDTIVAEPSIPIGGNDDEASAIERVRDLVNTVLDENEIDVVISPQVHDLHHGHEFVASGVRAALAERATTWWQYGLWHELPLPTLFVPFGEDTLESVLYALDGYPGELERNDFGDLYPAQAIASAVQGSERVFGFGAMRATNEPYAELFTEVSRADGAWRLGATRVLDVQVPLQLPTIEDISWWVEQPSIRLQRLASRK
jgi:LmbE family N-acetylglucosaminyl deacetylase